MLGIRWGPELVFGTIALLPDETVVLVAVVFRQFLCRGLCHGVCHGLCCGGGADGGIYRDDVRIGGHGARCAPGTCITTPYGTLTPVFSA